jgi:acyl-CoA thioester hydrolase
MITFETKYRVCYGDTDKMGVMYYGHYPRLYEIGRTDLIREMWKSYREVEESGIILPVRYLNCNYYKPAVYDEVLTIKTIIKEIPKVKFQVISQIYNEKNELINEGEVVLGFINAHTGKPCRAPEEFTAILEKNIP